MNAAFPANVHLGAQQPVAHAAVLGLPPASCHPRGESLGSQLQLRGIPHWLTDIFVKGSIWGVFWVFI